MTPEEFVAAVQEVARGEEPQGKPPPKTTEQKAAFVDGVRGAAKTHAEATQHRMELEIQLKAARIREAQTLEQLQAARATLKKESEAAE